MIESKKFRGHLTLTNPASSPTFNHKAMADDSDGLSVFSAFINAFRSKIKSTFSTASKSQYPSSLPDGLVRHFSLAEIKAATGRFSRRSLIGRSNFGCVYKGVIGSLIVAIKRFTRGSPVSAFQSEVLLLCQLRHPNILALIGICVEDGEQIVVYEYMSNGNLGPHLSDADKLQWKRRLEICIAVASGLHYLHTGVKRVVIHRNVMSFIILIDEKWGAKISAFIFSLLGPSTLSSKPLVFKNADRIVGTHAFMAPEYAVRGEMSTMSDVYAFGVLLLEVLSGRCVTMDYAKNGNLISWCGENIEKGTVYEIVNPFLRGKIAPQCLKVFLEIADSCLAMEAVDRPMIGEVEATLELALELQRRADSETMKHNNDSPHEFDFQELPFHLPADSSNLVKWSRLSSSSNISSLHTSDPASPGGSPIELIMYT